MATHPEFESDKVLPLKITLPSALAENLQAFSEASCVSKSELVSQAIETMLSSNVVWASRRYFFPDLARKDSTEDFVEVLKKSRPGTFVKLVGGQTNYPSSAQVFIGVVHRIAGGKLFVELPMYLSRATNLLNNVFIDQSSVSIAAEATMAIPKIENVPNLAAWGGSSTMFMYEIDAKLIWEVESPIN